MTSQHSHWHSLKTRVTVFTLAIFVISLWVLALYATRMLREDMQHLLGAQQQATAAFVAEQINEELADRLAALELIASQIDTPLMGNRSALQARIEQRPILQILFNGGVFVTGPDGTAIADVPLSAGRIGTNYMDRESVAIPLKEGKTVIGRPAMGKKLGAPIFSMVAPIRDAQGRVIGALVATVNLGKPNFLDKIARNRYGQTGGYLLEDPKSRLIITGTDKSRIMQALPAPGVNWLIDRHVQGFDETGVTVNPKGVEVLASARRIPAAGWFIVASLPTAEAFAPIRDMQQRMLWATIVLTLLAGALIWWMLRRELAPMLTTVRTLARLSESNQFPHSLPITRQDEVGDLIGGFNRLLDVVAQRERALSTSRAFAQEVLDSVPEHIAVIDPLGTMLTVNESWRKYSRENSAVPGELLAATTVGANYLAMCRSDDDDGYAARSGIEAVLKGALPGFAFEYPCHSPTQQRWFAMSVSPLRSGGQGAVIAHRDITSQKLAELALQRQTQALTRSNAELEQFAYVASHDLRQPLRMVSSYVQLLERAMADKLDDETREMMHFATDGAKRMDQMLVSLLEYSRVGRKGEPMQAMAGRAAVDEALRFLAPAIAEAQATVRVSGDWPQVIASPDEFSRLWQNLIANAVKFRLPDRLPEIDITVTPEADGWRFCVADNGIGIDPAQFERLFKVFQRLHARDQYEGSGIGLAVARKIVERHGGRIWVESGGPGKGCRFCFTLAAHAVEQAS
jgi:signal transduction histidine kinase